MLNQVNQQVVSRGINIVDLRLRQVMLPPKNTEAVFNRMISDRQRDAQDIRSLGTQLSLRYPRRRRSRRGAHPRRRQSEIRGDTRHGRRGKEQDLRRCVRARSGLLRLLSLDASLRGRIKPDSTRMVMSPGSSFFRYFNDPTGHGSTPRSHLRLLPRPRHLRIIDASPGRGERRNERFHCCSRPRLRHRRVAVRGLPAWSCPCHARSFGAWGAAVAQRRDRRGDLRCGSGMACPTSGPLVRTGAPLAEGWSAPIEILAFRP